ncbi:MAG: hypothetical protein K2O18_08250, partial [Oscillospiraceae bacterium]|nr:hypothetical protein [Oscillospiraceae bacterium]
MTENREALCNGLSYAAWGYFFLNFDVNIQQVSILPRFAGFYLLLQAINRLAAQRRDLELLRPLCVLLMLWNAGDWLMSWAGLDLDGRFLFFDLLVGAAGLYFHFQFLTDLAALAHKYQPQDREIDKAVCKRRTVYV